MTRHRGAGPGELFVRLPHEQPGDGRNLWQDVASSPEFMLLRARVRRFVGLMTLGFLSWFFLYIGLNAWAPELLSIKVGGVTLVLILAVGQFASTFTITVVYSRFAARRLDPLADQIRDRLEDGGV